MQHVQPSLLPTTPTGVSIRQVHENDLKIIAHYGSRKDLAETKRAFRQYGFWGPDNGAVAIIDPPTNRLVGTAQYFRPGATVRGFELAYAIYEAADRNRGYASQACLLYTSDAADE